MKIMVLDSGIRSDHPAMRNLKYCGYSLFLENNTLIKDNDITDKIGHGTAICHIIHKKCPEDEIKVIKIFNETMSITEEHLVKILEYVYINENVDIINLSLGLNICRSDHSLYEICKKIRNKGVYIISAFDNTGSVSYPAAFDCVIGVDTTNNLKNDNEYEYVESSLVNIRVKAGPYRLAWIKPDYILADGSSFACAFFTTILAKQVRKGISLLENATYINNCIKRSRHYAERPEFLMKNVAIFPLNKEMHCLLKFYHNLDFHIHSVYDIKYSGRVGASIKNLLNDRSSADLIVQDINNINWNQIDTLILGHLDELLYLLHDEKLMIKIINEAICNGKNIYSFDPIEINYDHIYYPSIEEFDIPNNYGKLYQIPTPVLGVFGTSSKQGKFTLQLILRNKLKALNYNIGQLGSEPSSLLYGMDEIFHFGYNQRLQITEIDKISILNDKMHKISEKNYDLIITGSQSGTVPYNFNNLVNYPMSQLSFLYGTSPDAVILVVNVYDTLDYIIRTISVIENASDCHVIAICLFPMKIKEGFAGLSGVKTKITEEELINAKISLHKSLCRPIFELGNNSDMDELVLSIIDFF